VFCKISHLFEHTPICWVSAGHGFTLTGLSYMFASHILVNTSWAVMGRRCGFEYLSF
jgi:hypothetical protein